MIQTLQAKVSQFHVQIRREEVDRTLGRSRQHRLNKANQEEIQQSLNSILDGKDEWHMLAELTEVCTEHVEVTEGQLRGIFTLLGNSQTQSKLPTFQRVLWLTDCAIDGLGLPHYAERLMCEQDAKKRELGLKIARTIATKGIHIRDEIIQSQILTLTDEIVGEFPQQLMRCEGELFAALMKYPFQKHQREIVRKMIERQVRLLRSQHAHILSIVDGLCKCMRWREDWVFDVLRECNLLNELLNLLSECLAPQVVESVHYCIVLLANLSPLQQLELANSWDRFCDIELSLLCLPSLPKVKQDVFYTLSNIFCSQRPEPILALLSKNFLEILRNLLKSEKDRNVIAELAYALNCLVSNCQLEPIEKEIVRCGLLDSLLEKADFYRMYPETTVKLFVDIFQRLIEGSSLLRHRVAASRMVQEMIANQKREEIKGYFEALEDNSLGDW